MVLPLSVLGFGVTTAFSFHAYEQIAYILFAFMGGVHLAIRNELDQDRIGNNPLRAQGVPAGAAEDSLILSARSDIGRVE